MSGPVDAPALSIASIEDRDIPEVIALWRRCGSARPWNDPEADIARARRDTNSTVLLARDDGAVVASVLVGHDGHRGWVYYVTVDPDHRFTLDVADIAEVWRRGSVVSSWLLDLTANALAREERLESYSGYVEDSGEGRWTLQAAMDESVPAEVLSAALYARFRSRQEHTFAEKVISAMRKGFGGHVEPTAAKKG